MSHRNSFRTLATLFASGALLATTAVGCSQDDTASQGSDVTDIANSSVKDQSIGNCWIYATVGWAESLHLTQTGEELNLSESYITYWHWFEAIHGGAAGNPQLARLGTDDDGNKELSTGGWYATAAELMRRFGVVDEAAFIPDEADRPRSARQRSARDAINASLKDGVLSDPANRADAAIVRAELDAAWELSEETVAMLDETFGEDVNRTMYDGAPVAAGSGMHTVQSVDVGHDGEGNVLTLADAIGTPSYSYWGGPPNHNGAYAWTEQDYPAWEGGRRDFQIKIQRAMHKGLPAIMTWYVDFAALENDNTFKVVPEEPGRQGGHMTVLEDYQITNVPGYGTLEAGVLVTDPTILEAALSPEAEIEFFRIKNSWGSNLSPEPDQGDAFKGYYDLWMSYLDADLPKEGGGTARGLTGVVLPPDGFFSGGEQAEPEPEPACHDICEVGAALDASCDPCAAQIIEVDPFCTNDSWDDLCVEQVETVCNQTCN